MNEETKQDQGLGCSRWLRFLDESIGSQAAIDCLQEFFGYCLTEKVFLARALLVYGAGQTGKSIAMQVLDELVGPANTSGVPLSQLDDQDKRTLLYGSSVNFSFDPRPKLLESHYFKSIVSGDSINGWDRHKGSFVFHPTCKFVLISNHMPKEIIDSPALKSRILPIEFIRTVSRPDPWLFKNLKAEMDGIRIWAQAGLDRLKAQGRFTDPSGWE